MRVSCPISLRDTIYKRDFWIKFLVVYGLGLRIFHYGRNPSMWHDEGALVMNALDKDYGALLGPLRFNAAAPPLFLWLERSVYLVVGDSTFALRLLPLLASCITLLLLTWLARRMLHAEAVPCAVLLVACSDRLLWHTCEGKPYSLDVFIASLLITIFYGLADRPAWKPMAIFAALAPFCIFLAYPGVFLCVGLLLAMLPRCLRERYWHTWLAAGLFLLSIGVSSLLLLYGPIHAQRTGIMESYWSTYFPPWNAVWEVPLWILWSSAQVIDYCFRPLGAVLLPFVGLGAMQMWRQGKRSLIAAMLLPIALAFSASLLHFYPYGGSRICIFTLPSVAFLIAEAIPPVLRWIRKLAQPTKIVLALAISVPLFAPVVMSCIRTVSPWPRADSASACYYVLSNRHPGDRILANDWEHTYYFRHSNSDFRWQSQFYLKNLTQALPALQSNFVTKSAGRSEYKKLNGSDRIWLVLKAHNRAERQAMLVRIVPANWRVILTREFTDTTVALTIGL